MIPRGWVGRFLKKLMGTILYLTILFHYQRLSGYWSGRVRVGVSGQGSA